MDASNYLRKQGWRGDGHSLDHSNRGIKKPLLVSKKVDVLGLGLSKHAAVSDQWWLRAFDQGLKNFGTGQESALAQVQKHGVNRGGLYAGFIKGEKLEGSIGNTPNDTDGSNTPTQVEGASISTMGIDIPPVDKLERTVGNHGDKNTHDAMMYLLQNPEEAPISMHKMLDRKRKRAERPVEKRARRKLERAEKAKAEARQARLDSKKDGTWDENKEAERRKSRTINRRAEEFVTAAQQLGYIQAGPNEIRKGLVALDADGNVVTRGQPTDEQQHVFGLAGLKSPISPEDLSRKRSLKQEKFNREKMKRELKRVAKIYLKGDKPTSEMTEEEVKALREEKRLARAAKKNEAARLEAQQMADREDKAARKLEKRTQKKLENAEINRILAERKAAADAGGEAEQSASSSSKRTDSTSSNEFETGADEIKFGMTRKGGFKKIPGVGRVDKYPSKAEKKAKKIAATAIKEGITEEEVRARFADEVANKQAVEREKIDRYRAMKHGMTLEEYRTGIANGQVLPPTFEKKKLAPEKITEYRKRANEKGVSLEEYIRRREQKTAAKRAEKMGNPFQKDIHENGYSIGDVITAGENGVNGHGDTEMANSSEGLGFVIDTAGDNGDVAAPPKTALAIDGTGKALAIVDTLGDETYTYQPNMPVPLDPRVWEGQKVSDLPKAVRKARREWLRIRRETRKQAKLEATAAERRMSVGPPKKSKGQRKIEAREAFVKQVLFNSRQALKKTGSTSGTVTIEGIEGVPMVKVQSTQGIYSKMEVALARTVARRVLRNVKREEKAKKGKGKGYKKRERAAKDAAINAGISGFTDRARLDEGYRGGNRGDLLL